MSSVPGGMEGLREAAGVASREARSPDESSSISNMTTPIIRAVGLGKTFDDGRLRLAVLKDIDFAVARGERVAIVGASGTDRKSTRLNSVTNAHLVCRLLLEKKNN